MIDTMTEADVLAELETDEPVPCECSCGTGVTLCLKPAVGYMVVGCACAVHPLCPTCKTDYDNKNAYGDALGIDESRCRKCKIPYSRSQERWEPFR